jgi:hypothetical protein
VSTDDQVPEGGPTDDPGPFGEVLNLGLPDATAPAEVSSAPAVTSEPTNEPPAPKSHHRSLIIWVIGAAVVTSLAIVGFVVFDEASAAISTGTGTATITWLTPTSGYPSTGNPPQPFTGTIAGHPVSGIATNPITPQGSDPGLAPGSIPSTIKVFRYRGTFAGEPFDLGVFIHTPFTGLNPYVLFTIKGTWNGQAVNAVVTTPVNANGPRPQILFHGTIGRWRVSGFIHGPTGTGRTQTVTATFTVSS